VTVEVANQMQISHGSAYEIIQYRLHLHKVRARWVPKQHTEQHRHNNWTSVTTF